VQAVRSWRPEIKWSILGGVCLAALVAVACLGPIPQPLSYHNFADQRPLAGVPHTFDVLSNLPFVIVGLAGLWFLLQKRTMLESGTLWAYATLFAGLILTGLGSAFYHLAPDNHRLVFDRLPMTIAMAGCIAVVLADRFSGGTAVWVLPTALTTGIGTVAQWAISEQQGHGDLRWYALYQGLTIIVGAALLLMFASRPAAALQATRALALAVAGNVAAKIFELLDKPIYSLGGLVSGHTLKHLSAGLAFVPVVVLIRRMRAEELPESKRLPKLPRLPGLSKS
jgi:hypothetical protein